MVGPMVTNPATRDWTVTASVFATLNEMYGNRTDLRHRPRRLGGARDQRQADDAGRAARVDPRHPRARQQPRRSSTTARRCSSRGATGSELEVWVAAYGPLALKLDRRGRRRLHPAARRPRHRRLDDRDGARGGRARRPRPATSIKFCVAAPMYIGDDWEHMREQCRWFGGMVGNHVADIVAQVRRPTARCRRRSPTTSPAARATTTTSTAGPATPTPTFVPDEIVDRFCILGTADEHIAKLEAARRRSASTSSPATCSTTTRRRPSACTARRSSRRSPST